MNERNDSVGEYMSSFLEQIVSYAPKIIGALLILIIGYFIARLLAKITYRALQMAKLNEHARSGKGGNLIQRAVPDPSNTVSKVVYYLLILFTLSLAASALGIPALEQIVQGIYAYLPNVIAAVVIFLVAGAISAAVAALITNAMGDTPTGKIAATAAPVMVMGLAVFMILNQLKIAPEIVTITYAGLVATATLAFGLGGKDAASKMFLSLYETGVQNKGKATADMHKGAANARAKAHDLRDQATS